METDRISDICAGSHVFGWTVFMHKCLSAYFSEYRICFILFDSFANSGDGKHPRPSRRRHRPKSQSAIAIQLPRGEFSCSRLDSWLFRPTYVRGSRRPRLALSEDYQILPRDNVRRVGYFISCIASLFSLVALTVDRFIAITYPMKYRIKLNSRRTAAISLILWIISIGFPFLYFEVGYLKYQFFFANTAVVSTFAVLCLTYAKVFQSFKSQVKNWDSLLSGPDSENHTKNEKSA